MTTIALREGRCTGPGCHAYIGDVVIGGVEIKTLMKHRILLLPVIKVECHRCRHEQTVAEIMSRT